LSINYPVKASNLLVFGSVLDEALDFLLTILQITAATFQLKSQIGFHFLNQALSFTATVLLFVFHVAIIATSIRDYYAIASTFNFDSHNGLVLES
jgi:hypothetical protein